MTPFDPTEAINLINGVRASHGMPAVTSDPVLQAVSQRRADHEAGTDAMSHLGFPAEVLAAYPNCACSENVAEGQQTAADVVAAWQGDAAHLDDMIGPYVLVGVGYALDASGTPFWVADFVQPAAGEAVPFGGPVMVEGSPKTEGKP